LAGNQTMRMADLFRMISEIIGKDVEKVFLNAGASGHYETTPYSYAPQIGIKYASNRHVDLGQGLLMKIEEIFHSHPDAAAGAAQKGTRGGKA
jgi:UDP-glucose 4-epimerase